MKSKELVKTALAVGFVALAVGSGEVYASAPCDAGESGVAAVACFRYAGQTLSPGSCFDEGMIYRWHCCDASNNCGTMWQYS